MRCKRCGAHTLVNKHYETNEPIELDFLPTPRGNYLITELGYCGEVPTEDREALEQARALFFKRHDCAETARDRQLENGL